MTSPHLITDPWCQHIPQLHRVLADPSMIDSFPTVSRDLPLQDACAVWETLHYLLRGLLGWEDPGAGLAWWYASGQPVDESPLLEVVSRIWGRGDLLDDYAAWAWSQNRSTPLAPDESWWPMYRRRPEPQGHNPYHGGYNPLHLGYSDSFGYDVPSTDQSQLHFDQTTRRAVLVVNHIGSWRRDLQRAGEHLPEIGQRSWHVEVFDRQTGHLGLYRRSRETGRWFQGKHSLHLHGQARQTAEVLS
jgi:hypothetical protein